MMWLADNLCRKQPFALLTPVFWFSHLFRTSPGRGGKQTPLNYPTKTCSRKRKEAGGMGTEWIRRRKIGDEVRDVISSKILIQIMIKILVFPPKWMENSYLVVLSRRVTWSDLGFTGSLTLLCWGQTAGGGGKLTRVAEEGDVEYHLCSETSCTAVAHQTEECFQTMQVRRICEARAQPERMPRCPTFRMECRLLMTGCTAFWELLLAEECCLAQG